MPKGLTLTDAKIESVDISAKSTDRMRLRHLNVVWDPDTGEVFSASLTSMYYAAGEELDARTSDMSASTTVAGIQDSLLTELAGKTGGTSEDV